MKALTVVACVTMGLSSFARAEIRIPSSVFAMEELGKAKAKAVEEKKPLVFVYTDPETT